MNLLQLSIQLWITKVLYRYIVHSSYPWKLQHKKTVRPDVNKNKTMSFSRLTELNTQTKKPCHSYVILPNICLLNWYAHVFLLNVKCPFSFLSISVGGRSSILPTDWHVLILCLIFHLENLYFKLKWYVEYGNVLLNLFSQWNLCQYITFYRNHNFV